MSLEIKHSRGMSWYRLSKLSDEIKTRTRMVWKRLHKDTADWLDININQEVGIFIELSAFIADLTDELNRLPRVDEICKIWKNKHPEFSKPYYDRVYEHLN